MTRIINANFPVVLLRQVVEQHEGDDLSQLPNFAYRTYLTEFWETTGNSALAAAACNVSVSIIVFETIRQAFCCSNWWNSMRVMTYHSCPTLPTAPAWLSSEKPPAKQQTSRGKDQGLRLAALATVKQQMESCHWSTSWLKLSCCILWLLSGSWRSESAVLSLSCTLYSMYVALQTVCTTILMSVCPARSVKHVWHGIMCAVSCGGCQAHGKVSLPCYCCFAP